MLERGWKVSEVASELDRGEDRLQSGDAEQVGRVCVSPVRVMSQQQSCESGRAERQRLRARTPCLWLVCMIALATGVSDAGTAEPSDSTSPNAQITEALEQWWTALARRPLAEQPGGQGHPVDAATLDFALTSASPLSPADLPSWLAAMRPNHPAIEYRLAAVSIAPSASRSKTTPTSTPTGSTDYDTRFALERRSFDDTGLSHVARWQENWRIRLQPDAPPIVVSIEEEARLVFPGTGPQIICF